MDILKYIKISLYFLLMVLVSLLVYRVSKKQRNSDNQTKQLTKENYSSVNTNTTGSPINYTYTPSTKIKENNKSYHYVHPYITKTGKMVKGHTRKSISTNPNSYKNRARSRYYYETHKYIIKEKRRKK